MKKRESYVKYDTLLANIFFFMDLKSVPNVLNTTQSAIYLLDFYCQFFPYFQGLLKRGFRQTFTWLHCVLSRMSDILCSNWRGRIYHAPLFFHSESQGVCISSEISSTSSPMMSTGPFIPLNWNNWEFWTVNLSTWR